MSETGWKSLVNDATDALTRLDAEALEELGSRAQRLRALNGGAGCECPEVAARFRVFADVLRRTGEGLRVLERVRGAD